MKKEKKPFDGEIVLITGGTSGIGAATTKTFSEAGAKVLITGRRVEKGQELVERIREGGGEAIFMAADHTRAEDCSRVVQGCIERFGRIDVLFNNAGVVLKGIAEETSEIEWQTVMDINVTAVWRMSKLVIPHMRQQKKV